MKTKEYLFGSFINAAGTVVYVSVVAWLMFHGQVIFGKASNFLIPLFILLLFVISAAVTGLLVLGRSVHLYLGNFKKEAFILLFATLGWLIVFLAAVAIIMLL